ncbi:MAG: hypothetical protein KBC84_08840 [Proteobacteria bacterium]|nr:hypothetical protein [Pseudomonadota bacterium]
MGDSFFKTFFICCFVILFLAGAIMFMQLQQQSSDEHEVKQYLNTRGKSRVPSSWLSKMGKGI